MPVVVSCRCGQRFQAIDSLAGTRVSCPSCGAPLDIPFMASPYSAATFTSNPSPSATGYNHPDAANRGSSRSTGTGAGAILAIVGVAAGVFLLLAMAGVAVVVMRTAVPGRVSPGLDLQPRDYVKARRGFQTKLVHRGPSPQDGEPLSAPSGANRISYQSGNLRLTAFVDRDPADGQRRPGLLFLHGGFAYGDEDWEMPEPYRRAGYVVMIPVLRGENGQPGQFTLYYDEVDDVLAAAEALGALTYVDEERLFVVGHSAGGTLATLAAMASNRFRAAASLSGCMDQKLTVSEESALAVFDQSDDREFQLRSPVAYATSFKCPCRLYYGSREAWIGVAAHQTASHAKSRGIDVEAMNVPGDHFTSVPSAIEKSIAFFAAQGSDSPGGQPVPAIAKTPLPVIPGHDVPGPLLPGPLPPVAPDPPRLPERPVPVVPDPFVRGPIQRPPAVPRPPGLRRTSVVVLEMQGFNGDGEPGEAAAAALARIPWVDHATLQVDPQGGRITVRVTGPIIQTARIKAALQRAGFRIGATTISRDG